MRRMRMRSFVPGSGSSATLSSASSGSGRSVGGAVGSRSVTGAGGLGNRPESRKEVGDRWRMLYYQIRVTALQQGNQTLNISETGSDLYQRKYTQIMGALNPLKWKIRTFAYVSLVVLVFFFLFIYKKTHHVSIDAIIQDTEPKTVWEFVADFSNMKKLNPTIEDFNIVAESGNYDHWKYSAHYKEHLSHAPMIKNYAQSHFAVKPNGDDFLISSEHRTCFFASFGCLDSVSEFKFSSEGKNTKCVETVQYECPIVFYSLCHKEVMYQRQEIMKNLKSHFSTISIKVKDNDK